MRTDFPDFLKTSATTSATTEDGESVPIFQPDGHIITAHELDAAEASLGVKLPASYRTFLETLGPGEWCGDVIPHPQALFAFDASVWGLKGFVVLVDNVLGVGDRIAMNPKDEVLDSEQPVYYCSHDPFGHAVVAHSFEEWCRGTSAATLHQSSYYEGFRKEIWKSWRDYRKAHRWWKFWK